MTKTFSAVVIGCGRIGVGYDAPETEDILTHAKAFRAHPRTRLVGLADIDGDKARAAAAKWNTQAETSVARLLERYRPDIVSVCVPDELHEEVLHECLERRPLAVCAEKPLTARLDRTGDVVSAYRKAGIPLFVNFVRRFDPVFRKAREVIIAGELGRILYAVIAYTKGILHNGSHAIDAAHFLFGRFISGNPVSAVFDYRNDDPSLAAVLSFERCSTVFLAAADERAYSLFEIDVVGERGRIAFDHFGFRWRRQTVRTDPVFAGYRDLDDPVAEKTGLDRSLYHLVENVVSHLDGGAEILCCGEDALAAQTVCEHLISAYRQE